MLFRSKILRANALRMTEDLTNNERGLGVEPKVNYPTYCIDKVDYNTCMVFLEEAGNGESKIWQDRVRS